MLDARSLLGRAIRATTDAIVRRRYRIIRNVRVVVHIAPRRTTEMDVPTKVVQVPSYSPAIGVPPPEAHAESVTRDIIVRALHFR